MQAKARSQNGPYKSPKKAALGTAQSLCAALTTYLESELDDRAQATKLARFIARELLVWKVPTGKLTNAGGVVAFSFGNRLLKSGAAIPGPVNQRLAQAVIEVFKQTGTRVFAQWEIAECIGPAIPSDRLSSIEPDVSEDGQTVKYLSTADVILKVKSLVKNPKKLGRLLVLAHRDHVHRCLTLLRQYGFTRSFAPPFALPQLYDRKSGQPWTRERHLYLVHELIGRSASYRDRHSISR